MRNITLQLFRRLEQKIKFTSAKIVEYILFHSMFVKGIKALLLQNETDIILSLEKKQKAQGRSFRKDI